MTETPFELPSVAAAGIELSRTAALQAIRDQRRYTAQIDATPDERVALAARYGVLAVNRLSASIVLKTAGPELYRLTAHVAAEIVQECGVSLEPVTQSIDEEHEEILTSSAALLTPIEDLTPDPNSPTELISGDTIDYGEIVAQIVALAIDPFPRKPDAGPVAHIEHDNNPFAALRGLHMKTPGKDPAND